MSMMSISRGVRISSADRRRLRSYLRLAATNRVGAATDLIASFQWMVVGFVPVINIRLRPSPPYVDLVDDPVAYRGERCTDHPVVSETSSDAVWIFQQRP